MECVDKGAQTTTTQTEPVRGPGGITAVISLRLDGFSRDGQRIFGILPEGGQWPTTTLFDYDATNGNVQVVDLNQQFARIIPASCSQALDVIGTTDNGGIVVELNSPKPCSIYRRWLIDPAGRRPQRLPPNISILGLYKMDTAAL